MSTGYAFPDRVCEACGRKCGGHPNKGLDNVIVTSGHQLCGHCEANFTDWFWSQRAPAITKWKVIQGGKPEDSK